MRSGRCSRSRRLRRSRHEARVLFHADACQTVGRLPVDVHALDVDLLSLSAHKFGGPPGTGALYVRRGVPVAAYPCGDDRERRRRSGMENVPGVAAMAAALDGASEDMADQAARQWALTERIRARSSRLDPRAHACTGTRRSGYRTSCASPSPISTPRSSAWRSTIAGSASPPARTARARPPMPPPVLEHLGYPGTPSFRVGIGAEDDRSRHRALARRRSRSSSGAPGHRRGGRRRDGPLRRRPPRRPRGRRRGVRRRLGNGPGVAGVEQLLEVPSPRRSVAASSCASIASP